MKKIITQSFLLFLMIIFFFHTTYARKAGLQDIAWDKVDGNLIVSFKMTEISNLKILPFDWLGDDGRYQIGIKTELSEANLPRNLRSAFFFSPSWGFETDWYILDFNH